MDRTSIRAHRNDEWRKPNVRRNWRQEYEEPQWMLVLKFIEHIILWTEQLDCLATISTVFRSPSSRFDFDAISPSTPTSTFEYLLPEFDTRKIHTRFGCITRAHSTLLNSCRFYVRILQFIWIPTRTLTSGTQCVFFAIDGIAIVTNRLHDLFPHKDLWFFEWIANDKRQTIK